MIKVTKRLGSARRQERSRLPADEASGRNPDEILNQLDVLADQLDLMAQDEDEPTKEIICDMARVIRRAGKDAGRILRDSRGY